MKKWVVAAVAGGVVVAVGVLGWWLYERNARERDSVACFNGADPDACFRQAVIAYRDGEMALVDTLIGRHCVQRNGTDSLPVIVGCVRETKDRVSSSALR